MVKFHKCNKPFLRLCIANVLSVYAFKTGTVHTKASETNAGKYIGIYLNYNVFCALLILNTDKTFISYKEIRKSNTTLTSCVRCYFGNIGR